MYKERMYLFSQGIADRNEELEHKHTSCESNGFIPDFISIFAKTKYFKQVVRLGLPDSS